MVDYFNDLKLLLKLFHWERKEANSDTNVTN